MSANPEREQFASDLQLMKHRTERRLTPTECETLQSFPKGWTVPATEHWAMRSPSRLQSGLEEESWR